MAPNLELHDEPFEGDAARALVGAFIAEIGGLYPGWGPTRGPSAEPKDFAAPDGRFVIAYVDGVAVGCGGVKRLDDAAAEIKRMYVAREARGTGIAARVLARLEAIAAEMGCSVVRLDTGAKQPAALALYRNAGYHEIDDYNMNPFARYWLEKKV
jgi:GNAT superfamily N-acetyltransferase